ncbi:hypothetical protein COB21_00190 [Candidatus Aerophobetes bacterium]|uniref:DUF502 domain-containing protein n=1 Tax=Aerophobetes bacterium TaxID=2030807 RepID=A0A2A4X7V8_UNCAE|nr:MAG: hypothetical protein COB21_00190 [Candidatus Aerophobetes bacterium]
MKMKRIFLAGLATILPIAITIFIVHFFVDLLTAPFLSIFEDLVFERNANFFSQHRHLLVFFSQIAIVISFLFLTFIVGIVGRRYLFSLVLRLSEKIVKRIPIVKTIYKITRDVTTNVFAGDNKNIFKERVLVPFPHDKTYAMGLMTDEAPEILQNSLNSKTKDKKKFYSIFVPTSPHPISGFLMLYSEEDIKTVDISTEDLFKFLLSCGMYDPKNQPDEPKSEKSQ